MKDILLELTKAIKDITGCNVPSAQMSAKIVLEYVNNSGLAYNYNSNENRYPLMNKILNKHVKDK